MSLASNISSLVTRIATELKAHRILINNNAADLSALTTTAKANIVAAINELKSNITALGSPATINDGVTNTTATWSSSKITSHVTAAVNAVIDGAPGAIDTLNELAAAIGDDANFASTVTTALGNRLRIDAAQGLTAPQQQFGRDNLDVYSKTEVGSVTTDFVAAFEAGLA